LPALQRIDRAGKPCVCNTQAAETGAALNQRRCGWLGDGHTRFTLDCQSTPADVLSTSVRHRFTAVWLLGRAAFHSSSMVRIFAMAFSSCILELAYPSATSRVVQILRCRIVSTLWRRELDTAYSRRRVAVFSWNRLSPNIGPFIFYKVQNFTSKI